MRLGRQTQVPIFLEEFQPVIKKITELEALWRMTEESSSKFTKGLKARILARILARGDASKA